MKATPLFLGACALACIAGAVSGAGINTTPLKVGAIGSEEIRRPAIVFDAHDTGRGVVAAAEHYAMVTPEGRVEVAELASRGLYSQKRFGYRDAAYEPDADYGYSSEAADAKLIETELPAVEENPAPIPATAQPALALAAPAQLPIPGEQGGMRIVDVSAALGQEN